ncbi:MAG: hypothetical protein NVSMB43_00410 [Pseudarthrobacter sp.]
MVCGEEDAHRHPADEHEGCLGLVAEPQLVRLGPAVHPRQRPEDGVDDQVRPAQEQEDK